MSDLQQAGSTNGDTPGVPETAGEDAAGERGTSALDAADRDRSARERDRRAEERDGRARMRDRAITSPTPPPTLDLSLEHRRAADDRAQAAADRLQAAADREAAAMERAKAAREQARFAREQAEAALERELAETDDLTGVRRRGPGLRQLAREIDRARRAEQSLVVAFVDVDALKSVNDTEGHLAGDALLISVADSLRTRLRLYDLVLRFGGDEFVCALPDSDVEGVQQRFAQAARALAASPTGGSITVGFAQLQEGDSAESLIARADADLLGRRGPHR